MHKSFCDERIDVRSCFVLGVHEERVPRFSFDEHEDRSFPVSARLDEIALEMAEFLAILDALRPFVDHGAAINRCLSCAALRTAAPLHCF